MKRQVKQILGLSAFATLCMALGMGFSYRWVAQAQEDKPVLLEGKGAEYLPPIAEVADKLSPTVVSITNTSFVKRSRLRSGDPFNPFGDDFFNWFFGPNSPRQPRPGQDEEQREVRGGSGVVISPDGEILTNAHVVEGARGSDTEIEVRTAANKTYKATILGRDRELDIALIKIESTHLPYAKIGNSDAMRIGDWVVAIGNPFGLDHTVTQGIISGKGRKIVGGVESFLQTDAAINRGNSGGPLLNLRGEIIGINTAINPAGQNIGFSVPINMVKHVLPDLRSGKAVSRGYLGITPLELDKTFQESLGVKEGVVVSSIQKDQAADKAKVQRLDVITAVDGEKVRTPDELVYMISNRKAGESIKLTLWREGKSIDITVVLGDRKNIQTADNQESQDDDGNDTSKDSSADSNSFNLEKSYGFTVEGLNPATRHQYGIPEDVKGVVVTDISTRSKAAEQLAAGMIITAVGRKEITKLQEFMAEVKKVSGKPLLLLVKPNPRGSQQRTVAIPPR